MPGVNISGFGVGGGGIANVIQNSRGMDIQRGNLKEAKKRRRQDLMLQIAGLTRQGLGDIIGFAQTGEELGIRGKMADAATKQADTGARELALRYPTVTGAGGGAVPLDVAKFEWQKTLPEAERLHDLNLEGLRGGRQERMAADNRTFEEKMAAMLQAWQGQQAGLGRTHDVSMLQTEAGLRGAEAEKGRTFTGGENALDRAARISELAEGRTFTGGENKADRDLQAAAQTLAGERFTKTQGLEREKMAQDLELALKALAAKSTPEQEIATQTTGAIRADDVQKLQASPYFQALPAADREMAIQSMIKGVTLPSVGGIRELERIATSPDRGFATLGIDKTAALPENMRSLATQHPNSRAERLSDMTAAILGGSRPGPEGAEALRLFAQQAAPYIPQEGEVGPTLFHPMTATSPFTGQEDFQAHLALLKLLRQMSTAQSGAPVPQLSSAETEYLKRLGL